jgi:two-component system, NtrC family, sensor histidine kinase HydH
MTPLYKLIEKSGDWLVHRVLHYGKAHGYTTAVSLPEETWKIFIEDITQELLQSIRAKKKPNDLTAGIDYTKDPAALFGAKIVSRLQHQNIPFDILFGLMKYYRQSFVELVREGDFGKKEEEPYRLIVDRFFDRLEIGLLIGWPQKRTREEIRQEDSNLEQRVIQRTTQMEVLSRENDKKLQELSFLYRMSNTMLSTIQLNKLAHLILSALTSGAPPFFDRSMLFLINERSATMQGMLGVTRDTSAGLIHPAAEIEDILASRWDISEDDMAQQQDSEFSRQVKGSRLEINKTRNIASRAVLEKKIIFVADTARNKGIDMELVRRFGIRSCAIAPLMAKQKVIGVVVVDNALCEMPITKDDLRFLQLFTNQAGMAIENSFLYNRLEDANRSLREAREHLIQGERLSTIGEMATSIAHEIKGPLVSIGGFARRLEKSLPANLVEHDHAATIVREVQRLEKMLTDILSFSRKTAICYSFCNIVDIFEECLAITSPAFDEHNVKVFKNYPMTVISLLGDSQQLKQVFLNLLMNAQEAMRHGGDLRITISPANLNGSDAVSIKIADTGGGIPLQSLSSIFNSFFTTKETGTGLGLPIANRIVTNHGGKIQVNNKSGIGVEFNVVLPLNP